MYGSESFADFYASAYGRICSLITLVLGDRALAEDVTQEAFARAYAHWQRVLRYEVPEAWVRKVALRLAVDSRRRVRRADRAYRQATAMAGPLQARAGEEAALDVRDALMRIPLREREVIVLHYLFDLSVRQIAVERGLPPGTVKSRLAAGRKRLERELSGPCQEVRDER